MVRLRELREQRHLNQEGLAMMLNVSQSTISAYENDDRKPDVDTLISISQIFNVSIDYLVGLSEIKNTVTYSDLASDELEFLHVYRQLSNVEREKVKAYTDGLLSK